MHRGFLVNLCLVLAIVALPLASGFVVIPSCAAAQGECNCSHLKMLQIELRNALRLQQAFLNKIAELRAMGRNTSQVALKQFSQGEARQGIEPVPGYNGPSEFDYDSWGRTLYNREGTKHSNLELCGMTPYAMAQLYATIAASACQGIGWAIRAHEEVHVNFCNRIGFAPYEDMHGADRAQEEAEAYGAQIKVLRDTIAKLRCGYRATAQMGDTKFSSVVCSLEKPFTIEGNNPVMTYPIEFTPSSVNSGTWVFKAVAHGVPVRAFGSGSYTVEGANTATPHLVLTGSSTGIAPPGTITKGGTSGFDLVPLDTGECGQSPQ